MIIILDTTKGQAHNFKTRKDAGLFIGVSLPTLRGWLTNPFYLHKSLIITHTSHEKVKKSNRALLKKKVAQFRKDEIDRVGTAQIQRDNNKSGGVPINGTRSKEPAKMDGIVKPEN